MQPKLCTENANFKSLNQIEYDRANLTLQAGFSFLSNSYAVRQRAQNPIGEKQSFFNILSWFSGINILNLKFEIKIFEVFVCEKSSFYEKLFLKRTETCPL